MAIDLLKFMMDLASFLENAIFLCKASSQIL